jgi:hypothetical protein
MKKIFWVTLCAAGLLVSGCDSAPQQKADNNPPSADKMGAADKKAEPKVADARKPAAADAKKVEHYQISADALDLKVGEAGELAIQIKPSPGFKVNEEFPWKASLSPADNLTVDAEARQDKWALSKEAAALKLPITAKAAGDGQIKASLNFSVCDENACEVIRDREVIIKVAAR